ncbi:glycosyltransferase [Gloeobacter kilaueensis]|uniref:Glycosyl transferase group 1 n=1 Tax=Gloeobacter kilaueensis (strain ATCC BAA-2537 / CCAP 1431/1 / ULC 316 / JS1) TaxID=1183438 RepID=U5QC03_GLOK1|nr:glycosyltransferase [Gloeobacter kilaueensis]AGY56432.1 glycosyl transferase group 1 [Gloeobacter kilaueensis JS1]
MKVCIVTPFCLSNSHGTGVQLLRLFADDDYSHLYWSSASGFSECDNSLLLEEQFNWWKFSRGKGRLEQLMGLMGLSSVWRHNELISDSYRNLLAEQYRPDLAYVVVIDETSAQKAVSLLEVLGCPYIVHIMDLMHPGGLQPQMSGFRRLFAGASGVFALSENIRQEVLKFPAPACRVFPIVRSIGRAVQLPPGPDAPLRIVMVGSLYYQAGLQCLAQAWDSLIERYPRLELVYAGPQSQIHNYLPARLKKILDYRGYLRNEEVEAILLDCHLAYLPGPCLPTHKDKYSKYSIPSRLTDYLMAGLPIVAYLASGSATEQFLTPLMPLAVRRTMTPGALAQAVQEFVERPERWQAASRAAHTFACEQCSVEGVRETLMNELQRAAGIADSRKRVSAHTPTPDL